MRLDLLIETDFLLVIKSLSFDWINNLEKDSVNSIELGDSTVYLLYEKFTRDDVVKWLKKNFDKVFQKELEVWSMDERSWPRNRTYQMFTEWLDIKFYLELYDFESFPVEKEEE